MTAHARKRQDIGLQPGATGRVGRGKREDERRKFGIVVGGHVAQSQRGGNQMRRKREQKRERKERGGNERPRRPSKGRARRATHLLELRDFTPTTASS